MFSGSIALYRCSDGFIINAEAAPFIFGINTQLRYEQHLSLRAQETSEIALVPQQELYEIVEKNNLWESVARITDYSAAKIYTHCLAVSKLSAYEIIRHQLMTLMTEPEEIRQKMTAANYILSRSFLSRSGTMKILSYLKQAGFIDLRRGILMEISELPEKLNNYYMK
ncbi:TPA: helix-turn-helix domain-containing protein [Citrobacter gillenii]